MSGYIGKAKAVNFAKVDLPIRDGVTNIIEQDGSYYLKEGASIKDQNGNTIIASDGTIAGVDFTPIETQLDSIEQDITSLDTSIGLLEDSVENITYPAGGEIVIGGNVLASHTGADGEGSLTLGNTVTPASSYTFRNKLINGNFDVWQRGTSQTSSGYGSADRWLSAYVNGTTTTASQQVFTNGQTEVPGNPKYYLRSVVTTGNGSNNYAVLVQKIENVEKLSGKTVTLSFWAKSDANKNIATEFYQYFGGGSDVVNGIGVTTHSLTTSWQKFTTTVFIPSISGKTIGTTGNDYIQIIFYFDAGSIFNSRNNSLGNQSGTFDIAQVQLEEGEVATPFEHRPYGLELSLCQRYFFQNENKYMYFSARNLDSAMAATIPFPVEMRATPTITKVSDPSGFTFTWNKVCKTCVSGGGNAPNNGHTDVCGVIQADAEL